MGGWATAVHGGAGVDSTLPFERREEAKKLLIRCLELGVSALRSNLTAIYVVELRVGSVVVGGQRQCAAGASTGGRMNKRIEGIGDSPLIGAGTYTCNIWDVSYAGAGEADEVACATELFLNNCITKRINS